MHDEKKSCNNRNGNSQSAWKQRGRFMEKGEEMEARKEVAIAATDITSPELVHQNPMMPDPKGWLSSFNWVKVILKRSTKETPDFIGDYKASHVCKKVSGCCRISVPTEKGT